MTLRKVQSGQRLNIPASAYNAFVDAARDFRQRSANIAAQTEAVRRRADVVLVRNDSGSARQQFDILGIDGPLITPTDTETEFRARLALKGVTPEDSHEGRFVILAEPLAANKIGKAFIAGACPVRLSVDEDKEWQFAECADGEAGHLEAGMEGSAAILWREGGTGDQWAIVRLGNGVGQPRIVARITGSTSIGTNRWRYSISEVEYLKDGIWSTVTDGISGTAYNTLEANNSSTGVQGCGINVEWLPAGVALKPIGFGAVVNVTPCTNCETLATEYAFQASNLPDGQCED
jgi:hypothetical protein